MPLSDHRDTACPKTPKSRFEKTLVQRWPDAVGIGFPKCGTGTLGFIDCHSKLVFREAEPYFWNSRGKCSSRAGRSSFYDFLDRENGGLKEYTVPMAASDEILIEKTPDYTLGSQSVLKARAQHMKNQMPEVKLLVLLCDPATRAFSHIRHQSNVSF